MYVSDFQSKVRSRDMDGKSENKPQVDLLFFFSPHDVQQQQQQRYILHEW